MERQALGNIETGWIARPSRRIPTTVSDSFILDYIALVFTASCGVFQIAAARNGLHGLMVIQRRRWCMLLGMALLSGAFSWFFLSEPRNVPDTGQGLTGNEQFGYFFAASGAGLVFTLLVSSLINRRMGRNDSDLPPGIDALGRSNYFRALYRTTRPLLLRVMPRTATANRQSSRIRVWPWNRSSS